MTKRKLPNNECIICRESVVNRLNTCGHSVCEIKYEEIDERYLTNGISDVSNFIKHQPYTMELIWNISHDAIKRKQNRFRPFPNYFITDQNRKIYSRGNINDIINIDVNADEYKEVYLIFESMKIKDICRLTDHTNDLELIQSLAKSRQTKQKPSDIYYLLRFLILSNQTTIETELCEFTYSSTNKQLIKSKISLHKIKYDEFMEEKFGYSQNISYLYHGSPIYNWHSILRNGIKNCSNTKFMTTGKAHGAGVYLSDSLNTAAMYAGSNGIIAIVELQGNSKKWKKTSNVYVVEDESCILVRYLIKMPRFYDQRANMLKTLDQCINERLKSEISNRKRFLNNTKQKRARRIVNELKLFKNLYKYIKIDKKDINIKFKDEKLTIIYVHEYTKEDQMDNGEKICVTITMELPDQYPFSAPIIRIISPQLKHDQVTSSGIVCDVKLFGDEWSPTFKLISLFIQIHALIINESIIISLDKYPSDKNDYQKLTRAMTH